MFWKNVSSWTESKLKFRIILHPFNMLCGVKQELKFSLIINCLLLQARFLIFRCKTKNETPDTHMYLLSIKNAKLVENK